MDRNETIEIPFGAKDSELKGWEYTIPEGMVAEIKDGKIIVREKESEDERIRKALIQHIKYNVSVISGWRKEELIAWLEKQGKQNLANSAKTCKDEQNPASKIKIFLDDKVVTDTEIEKVCNLPQGTIASLFASSQKQDCLKWSEGDEDVINHLLAICAGAKRYRQFAGCLQEDITKYQTWLKSLKERVQPQQEWSEEDERIYKVVLEILNSWSKGTIGGEIIPPNTDRYIEWLKSLKDRYTWKPSDELMELLREVQQALLGKDCHNRFVNFMCDLKKLKG